MAKQGVSYPEVAAAADRLVGQGTEPSTRLVREILGTGSMNTLQKHMNAWRSARPVQQSTAYELPSELINAFGKELARGAAQAKSAIESELAQSQSEMFELVALGESLEAQVEDLTNANTGLTTERDQAVATAAERASEISKLDVELKREQQAGEAARLEVATANLRASSNDALLTERAEEIVRLRKSLEQASQAMNAADKDGAVLKAKLDAAEARALATEKREQAAIDKAGKLQEQIEQLNTQLSQARLDKQTFEGRFERAAAERDSALKAAELAQAASAELKLQNTELHVKVETLLTSKNSDKPDKA
jgi:chromosome segregation ATPase